MKTLKVLIVTTIMVMTFTMLGLSQEAFAKPLAATAPSLGAAGSYSVLGFSAVTNSGPTTLSGDLGVWSGTSITGLSEISVGGATHQTDTAAQDAQAAALAAVGSISGQASNGDLGALDGQTVTPGVYDIGAGSLGGGALTLDGPGVYIFRASSSLTSSGSVTLIGGARACDVYWYVPTLASLTGGSFVGTIIAGTGITFGTGVSLDGRALAIGGPVTLLSNSITGPSCAAVEEAVVEEGTAVPTVSGLPTSGGAPLRNEVLPLGLALLFGSLSIVVAVLIVRALRRDYRLKK